MKPEMLADLIDRFFDAAIAPFVARLTRLEQNLAALPPVRDGAPGRDGRDGRDGEDGEDGLGFDDISVGYDGRRCLTLRFVRGERVREFPIVAPWPMHCGVWREDAVYVRGDVVTHGGSWWIAQRDTQARPAEGEDWRLTVKRGRDGKDGEKGDQGEPGTPGRPGRDLTNLGPDGSKWS